MGIRRKCGCCKEYFYISNDNIEDAIYYDKQTYHSSCFINMPTTVWQKLSDIYNGTFKGMSVGIPPEHLLDMWKRKINMLNGIAYRNKTKGIVMGFDKRINYDLSILINKYDSYLRWLEKQRIIEAEKAVEKSENIVGKSIGYITANKSDRNGSDDISVLVDDIFG